MGSLEKRYGWVFNESNRQRNFPLNGKSQFLLLLIDRLLPGCFIRTARQSASVEMNTDTDNI